MKKTRSSHKIRPLDIPDNHFLISISDGFVEYSYLFEYGSSIKNTIDIISHKLKQTPTELGIRTREIHSTKYFKSETQTQKV